MVQSGITEIRRCYEARLAAYEDLTGTAHVKITICGAGESQVVTAVGSGMPPVDTCIANVINKLHFESQSAECGVFTNTFNFSPAREPSPQP